MEKIESSCWLLEGRLRQCKNMLPDGLNWLCYFAGSSKSHGENSFFFHIFGIPTSSRHEKCSQSLQTLFWVQHNVLLLFHDHFEISCLGELLIYQRMAIVKSKCILKKKYLKIIVNKLSISGPSFL